MYFIICPYDVNLLNKWRFIPSWEYQLIWNNIMQCGSNIMKLSSANIISVISASHINEGTV
jgi:hypothetical protein